VPLIHNVPDVSQVPKLSLPMGWRQVSWSSLLPIVFDPYHQAFKLTPAGPMPMTSEELQQGGLYRYVPGGDLHPEAALLPHMSLLSDGSDADVYNFKGVDWALPWCDFRGTIGLEGMSLNEYRKANSSSSQEMELSPVSAPTLPRYTEECDCPDNIIDLDDAWRWMSEKEQNPGVRFQKSRGKKWTGSRLQLTSRKWKQPIPNLIAAALAVKEEGAPTFLGKQNGRQFCPFKSVATPATVDITLLHDVEFTLMEFLCFFPLHYAWSKGADRLVYAGLSAAEIAALINMLRSLSESGGLSNSAVYSRISRTKQKDGTRVGITRPAPSAQSYAAEAWTYDSSETTDYPLLGLAHGLRDLPSGPDAGPLTALMVKCRAEGRYTTMLSEVPQLLEEAGIEALIDLGQGEPDKEMMARHSEAVTEYRKREKEKKTTEGGGGRETKRKRAD
jgi:hypothetical protein